MRSIRIAIATAGLSAAAITTACSSSSSAPSADTGSSGATGAAQSAVPSGKVVTIHTTNSLRFAPSSITTSSQTVKVKLVNDGSYPHNLQVSAINYTSKTITGDLGNKDTTFTLHFPKPGAYTFVCTYHASAGMRGQFIVK